MASLICAPLMLVFLLVMWLESTFHFPKFTLILALAGLPLSALGAVISAVVDFVRFDILHQFASNWLRFTLHFIALVVAGFIIYQTIRFMTHGMERLF